MCDSSYTRADLEQLIKELLNITEVPFQIKRQIREYCNERGFTYKGIARALCFLIEERNWNFLEHYSMYGIGLVKNVYQDAQTHYAKLRIQKEKEEKRQQEIIKTMSVPQTVIMCGRIDTKQQKKRKHIDISSL